MTHTYRICPTNKLIIEWRADLPGARWGFYRVCDSPADAVRSLHYCQEAEVKRSAPMLFELDSTEMAVKA